MAIALELMALILRVDKRVRATDMLVQHCTTMLFQLWVATHYGQCRLAPHVFQKGRISAEAENL